MALRTSLLAFHSFLNTKDQLNVKAGKEGHDDDGRDEEGHDDKGGRDEPSHKLLWRKDLPDEEVQSPVRRKNSRVSSR